jgi:hypothetical protein
VIVFQDAPQGTTQLALVAGDDNAHGSLSDSLVLVLILGGYDYSTLLINW